MGGMVDSAGGFLGLSSGPKNQMQTGNSGLSTLNGLNTVYADPDIARLMNSYGQGNATSNDILNTGMGMSDIQRANLGNDLATGATTGSRYATEQVQNNPILGQLFGNGGELSQAVGKEQQLQNQGYQLQPEDQTMYGQASGNIARQFGQQGNQLANSLASRGLSSSGAAGAQFSGLAGNQNEMLAQAQQGIMQQRFQNTLSQIGQQQNFINSLGSQAGNDIQQQYGRQLSGAQNEQNALSSSAQQQTGANSANNAATLQEAGFEQANKPKNAMDFITSGMGQGMQSALAGTPGQSASGSTTSYDANGNPTGSKQTSLTQSGSGMAGLFAGG